MKYKRLISVMLLSAALALQASAYTVTTVSEKPQWQMDWSYNQTRPDWQEPAAENFENWTVMLVKIEKTLLPYVSADDLLAIFINDELRGLSQPSVVVSTNEVDATQYLLKVYGNESYGDEVVITMKYYIAQLGQVFTLSETMTLDEELMLGFYEDFIPAFSFGSAKYPVVTTLDMTNVLQAAGITPAAGDIAAAFVGEECRGVWTMDDGQDLNVYLRDADEAFVLKYYDSTGNRVQTFEEGDSYMICDTTGDGVVDVADISKIIDVMAKDPSNLRADVNGDGVVDVADIATVMNYMASHARR